MNNNLWIILGLACLVALIMLYFFRRAITRFFKWLNPEDSPLASCASIVTIIAFPTIILSLIFGYKELKDWMIEPNIEIQFSDSAAVTYKVLNTTDEIAEDVLLSFGIFDLDSSTPSAPKILPLTSFEINYINPHEARGKFSLLGNHGTSEHRYFGFVMVSCKGCLTLNSYWVYTKYGEQGAAFYAIRDRMEGLTINASELIYNTESYLNGLIPNSRRKTIN